MENKIYLPLRHHVCYATSNIIRKIWNFRLHLLLWHAEMGHLLNSLTFSNLTL